MGNEREPTDSWTLPDSWTLSALEYILVDFCAHKVELIESPNPRHNLNMPEISVCKPSRNDVLFGRGHQCQNHSGNRYFREVVDRKKVQYVQTTKTAEKDAIAKSIFKSIKTLNPPGRFLKKCEDGHYYASSDKDALAKIKQALRENSKNLKEKLEITGKGMKRPMKTVSSRPKKSPSTVTNADMHKLATLILDMD